MDIHTASRRLLHNVDCNLQCRQAFIRKEQCSGILAHLNENGIDG